MKTMKLNNHIVRVPEDKVDAYLKDGYEFCSKSEWKELRDEGKTKVLHD
jgi:hypothetical protein